MNNRTSKVEPDSPVYHPGSILVVYSWFLFCTGNFGSAFIEIHVSSSSPPGGPPEWLTLLPSCMLMTVHDSRAGRNKTATLTCTRERFSATAAQLKWSCIKLICRQPYNLTAQFGLQNVAFYTESGAVCSPMTPRVSQSPQHKLPSTALSDTTPQRTTSGHRLPPLPSAVGPCKQGEPGNKTPHVKFKRPLREANDESCTDEFSGVEQSRLLSNALKAPHGESHSNPILDRIASEREKVKEEMRFEASYQKKRLLVKELHKAERKADFTAGFDKASSKSVEMSLALRKISRHGEPRTHTNTHTHTTHSLSLSLSHTHTHTHTHTDNDCEIGQEPEHGPWGVRGRGRRGRRKKVEERVTEDGWVSKRRKKLSGMISDCEKLLGGAGTAVETASDTVCASDSDSDATVIMDDKEPLSPPPSPLPSSPPPPPPPPPLLLPHDVESSTAVSETKTSVQCPLCGQHFPGYAIELHAATCSDTRTDISNSLLPVYID